MHEHIGACQLLPQQVAGSVEVLGDVEGLVVDCWQVEVLDVPGERGGEVLSASSSDDCANAESCMESWLRCRVAAFCAAYKLLMKMPPLP